MLSVPKAIRNSSSVPNVKCREGEMVPEGVGWVGGGRVVSLGANKWLFFGRVRKIAKSD